jgi:signal transduction histidine kinase
MLSYGLHAALRELVDDLGKRAGAGLAIELAVPLDDVRFSPKIEQHAFRIIQQSCENALRHAAPRHIVIEGKLSETSIDLRVKDDGRGFEMDPEFDFSQLLAKRHFGLASMFERAALISADLEIHSEVGKGTEVRLVWELFEEPLSC